MRHAWVILVAAHLFVLGCGSSSSPRGGTSAGGAAGIVSDPGDAAITGSGGSNTGGVGQAGTGGASAGGAGGASTGQTDGAPAGGAGGATTSTSVGSGGQQASTSEGGTGGEAPSPGGVCAYTDTSSKLNAIKEPNCDTGYCLWDGRYFAESYCTIACTGSCPAGYECVADSRLTSKSWCARTPPTPPADLGTTCPKEYLPDCTSPTGIHSNFCLTPSAPQCERGYCVYDGASQTAYCSTPCRAKTAPCPNGWDCWHNPGVSTSLYDACIKHHEPAELVGLSCYIGSSTCQSGVACVGNENGTVPSCAPQGGLCLNDLRTGVSASARTYCTMRCETDACPTGYECLALTSDSGGTSFGMFCLKQLPSP